MVPPAPARGLTIGAVLAALRDEFPDVTVSKIRFLEAEGLVKPARTPSGYRVFTAPDVDRVRYVLRAQRDRFWPLRVIRESLDALDRGLVPGLDEPDGRPRPPVSDPHVAPAAELAAVSSVRLTRQELCAASGLAASQYDALEGYGLLRPDDAGYLAEHDLEVARAASGLAAFGIEPRHLRPFRTAADREVGLVDQAAGPRHVGSERAQAAAEVARLCLLLHTGLVKGGLAQGEPA